MDYITLALVSGVVVGVLALIPMLAQRGSTRACIAVFLLYFFAAVIVFYGNLPYLPWWGDGMGTTIMMTLPLLFILAGKERKTIPVLLLNALLLGFLISVAKRLLA